MFNLRVAARKALGWSHRWLGFVAGIAFCAMAFTGGIVAFRPQIGLAMAAPSASICAPSSIQNVDWNQAEKDIETYAGAKINRIYAPTAPDTRYHLRIMTDQDSIYGHVFYDACTNKVTGSANLAWMDWMVDFHHNLRNGKTGRLWAGWIGLLMLLSSIGGLAFWLMGRPSLVKLTRIRPGFAWRDMHTMVGVGASLLMILGSFTAMALAFPQTFRAGIGAVMSLPADARVPRPSAEPPEGTKLAGLGDMIRAAQAAIPGADWREIRMPDGPGNVQIRMWLPGDFRSLGNNVATVNRVTGQVMGVDLYSTKTPAAKIVQAMAGLHYGEWGGLAYRGVYGVAGLLGALLLVSGYLLWWLPKLTTARARRPSLASVAVSGNS